MKKKALLSFSIIAAIVLSGIIFSTYDKKEYKYERYINEIETNYDATGMLGTKGYENSIQKINQEEELNSEEYFLLAYSKELLNDDLMNDYYKMAAVSVNKGTNTFVKYYSAKRYIQSLLNDGQYEEAINIVKNIYSCFSDSEVNKYPEYIKEIVKEVLHIPNGREAILEIYEDIIYGGRRIKTSSLVKYKSSLVVLYTLNGNYAKGIEVALQNISEASKKEYAYYNAKSMVDLGIIFMTLNNYEDGKKTIENSLSIDIDDKDANAFIKCYALINLLDIALYLENSAEIDEIYSEFKEYYHLLNEQQQNELKTAGMLCEIKKDLIEDDFEAAEAKLAEVKKYLSSDGTSYFIDIELYYNIFYGELLINNDSVKEAIELYEKTLLELEEKENYQYKKILIKNLVLAYDKIGNFSKKYNYLQELFDQAELEGEVINDDYTKYAMQKYEHNLNLAKENDAKLKIYIIIFTMIIVFVVLAVRAYMRYEILVKINKMDGLTGALNRRYFETQYRKLLESEEKFYVTIFDVDNFKSINDTYGHVFADKILIEMVELVNGIIGNKGELFRYGGEEFVILMPRIKKDQAIEIDERIRREISNKKWGNDVVVTVSMGLAENLKEYEDVLAEADRRLYISKNTGKNKITY